MSSLNKVDIELLELRSTGENIESVCSTHKRLYLGTFEDRQRICYDPFKKHGKMTAKKSLKPISLTMARKYKTLGLFPGTKLCITCLKDILSSTGDNLLRMDECDIEDECDVEDQEYTPDPSTALKTIKVVNYLKFHHLRLPREHKKGIQNTFRLALKFQKTASEVLHVPAKNVSEETGKC
ncbi:ARL14 effector protein-like [Schistocerca cancellata]|uniref:ARL14 effector protein-like n=1 Tax=Schistocerca cancellata TaxID=274614 RepID=UPI002117A7F4|nr:ARL14 effector protein-like [Schistocerca cancellata]